MNTLALARETHRLLLRFFARRSDALQGAVGACARSLRAGGKILVFGNGGSAAQAQHFAAEMVNRFQKNRRALAALALTTDTSTLTSIANDFSFVKVFSRQIEALGAPNDTILALSTSGNSPNILKGLAEGRKLGMATVGLTGLGGGKMAALCDFWLEVPSTKTPRIQEIHLVALHVLAEEVEKRLA